MIGRFLIIFFLIFPAAAGAAQRNEEAILDYHLSVSFDIPAAKIFGTATIRIPHKQNLDLFKENLKIVQARLDGHPVGVEDRGKRIHLVIASPGVLEIQYEGVFKGHRSPLDPRSLRFPSVIDERGIWMTAAWYPKPDRLCRYRLTAHLPGDFDAVSEGEKIERIARDGRVSHSFDFPHPLDLLHLIATNRYRVAEERHGDIELYAYFFGENQHLAPTYLAHAKKYLDLYEKNLGKYPYKRFAIVENFLPTGYSMPTFTLLGSGVIQLPFLVETSLGHEILHQWFGNSVYIDYSAGNWAEGLTTYLADHLYEDEKGRGWEYRKKALIDYQSYVNPQNDFPLRDFQSRSDGASEAIGYGKSMMVFHLLKSEMGESVFWKALHSFISENRFQKASWEDLQAAFAKASSQDLSLFFRQWIEGKGLPGVELEGPVKTTALDQRFEVSFSVVQKERIFRLLLPVSFYTLQGKTKRIFPIAEEKTTLRAVLDSLPLRMVIDEDYDLARKLSVKEFPPVIARLLGEPHLLIARYSSQAEKYAGVMEALERRGARIEDADWVSADDLKGSSALFLGSEHPLINEWLGSIRNDFGFSLLIKRNPWNEDKILAVAQGRSKEEVEAAFPKVRHYGKFSQLSFEKGVNVSKGVEESERGILARMAEDPIAVDLRALKSVDAVLEQTAEKKIIYVGESHDRFSHHVMQLEIIRGLLRKGKKIAIGMEMFQRPFQQALDDYIHERIDEREFLKGSEYFKRWGFDYKLYRPILQFARQERIPIVALNAPKEFIEKISRSGLASLSAEERKGLPRQMDFTDEGYRDRLRKVYEDHKSFGTRDFDFFLQAQIGWDETMAEAIDSFLKQNPEFQMVALAGTGHIAFGSGIPKRAFRRNGFPYATILNDGPLERGAADFVLIPGTVPFEGSPKLMVIIKEEKEGVVISEFPEGSISAKAGLLKGDTILALDQVRVQGLEDIRAELAFKKKGEPIRVKVRRPSPSGENQELEISVIP